MQSKFTLLRPLWVARCLVELRANKLVHHLKAMSRLNVKVEDEDDLDEDDTFEFVQIDTPSDPLEQSPLITEGIFTSDR